MHWGAAFRHSVTFLATTSQKFSTSFRSFRQRCRAHFPTTWLLPCPAPITRRWKLWSCNHYLAPVITSLVSCPLSGELYKSCLYRGNAFYWSAFLCKELLPGLVDMSLQWFNKTLHRLWGCRQRTKCCVTSSYAFHVYHTVLLALPLQIDTVSVEHW